MTQDELYMYRALHLARRGLGFTSPNPMVGAVIVSPEGDILGEGYHRLYGGPHAEVNAVSAVSDKSLLSRCTIYVTLEPCSHYGKTPPCALLLEKCGFKRVVVATVDPDEKVCGRGIALLRRAGISVDVGVLENHCRSLNARFLTARISRRPFVALKFARTSDGWLGLSDNQRLIISGGLSMTMMHRFRSFFDAILVGSGTVLSDKPSLNTRLYDGRSPRPVILDRRSRLNDSNLLQFADRNPIVINHYDSLSSLLSLLYEEYGITSLLVEGGGEVLRSFVEQDLWDIAREEISPIKVGPEGVARAPIIQRDADYMRKIGANTINYYSRNPLVDFSLWF